MGILPRAKPGQADSVTRQVLDKFSFLTPLDRRDDKVKVLVVRGYYLDSMGKKGANDRGMYDDAIFVSSPDGVTEWNGNSDPSVYRHRVASIASNQAIRYRPGLHGYSRKGGPYPAFRQDENCTVMRDGVGADYGMFAVNLHRGGSSGTSSLGCLTVPPQQWSSFYDHLKGTLKRSNQSTFYVTVLEYQGGFPPLADGDEYGAIVLDKGDEGPLVAMLIRNLTSLNYYDGVQDSKFGNKTERAVKEFQDDHNLEVDGKAGKKTLMAIDKAVASLAA